MRRNGAKHVPPKPIRPVAQPVSGCNPRSLKFNARNESNRLIPTRKTPLRPITPRYQSPSLPKSTSAVEPIEVTIEPLPAVTIQTFHRKFEEMIVMCMHMCPFHDLKAESFNPKKISCFGSCFDVL
jgi:hypothetical protein